MWKRSYKYYQAAMKLYFQQKCNRLFVWQLLYCGPTSVSVLYLLLLLPILGLSFDFVHEHHHHAWSLVHPCCLVTRYTPPRRWHLYIFASNAPLHTAPSPILAFAHFAANTDIYFFKQHEMWTRLTTEYINTVFGPIYQELRSRDVGSTSS